mmetsp:Transcript_25467/g.59271  ORF Transcript_25467/g.59271 Transcript_25467/m.59271 type:complete len:247 (+) Transcript_25467:41-781(+)
MRGLRWGWLFAAQLRRLSRRRPCCLATGGCRRVVRPVWHRPAVRCELNPWETGNTSPASALSTTETAGRLQTDRSVQLATLAWQHSCWQAWTPRAHAAWTRGPVKTRNHRATLVSSQGRTRAMVPAARLQSDPLPGSPRPMAQQKTVLQARPAAMAATGGRCCLDSLSGTRKPSHTWAWGRRWEPCKSTGNEAVRTRCGKAAHVGTAACTSAPSSWCCTAGSQALHTSWWGRRRSSEGCRSASCNR